jgi:Domain of unknown function (DUF5666)
MRRASVVVSLFLAGIVGVMEGGCGGSSALTAPDEPKAGASGASVLHGAVLAPGISSVSSPGFGAESGAGGWLVSVAGTSSSSPLDQDGRFVLTGVPAGSVTLKIEGPDVSTQLTLSGLVDGQVMSVEIQVTGGSAQLVGPPKCTPNAETYFSGTLDQVAGGQLVAGGRKVDASKVAKVWRGERRIQLSELEQGERVKVWGLLRGDAVVVAEEIAALTSGSDSSKTWVTFSGRVEAVEGKSLMPNPTPTTKPGWIVVAGRKVKLDSGTQLKWSDGSGFEGAIQVGDVAAVEGWSVPEGYVIATRIQIAKR